MLKDQSSPLPMLSRLTAFIRRWHTIQVSKDCTYAPLEKGQQDFVWLRDYLAKQAPEAGIQFFSLDCTVWERPEAHTLLGWQYVYQPNKTYQGSVVVIEHAYSLLD